MRSFVSSYVCCNAVCRHKKVGKKRWSRKIDERKKKQKQRKWPKYLAFNHKLFIGSNQIRLITLLCSFSPFQIKNRSHCILRHFFALPLIWCRGKCKLTLKKNLVVFKNLMRLQISSFLSQFQFSFRFVCISQSIAKVNSCINIMVKFIFFLIINSTFFNLDLVLFLLVTRRKR